MAKKKITVLMEANLKEQFRQFRLKQSFSDFVSQCVLNSLERLKIVESRREMDIEALINESSADRQCHS